MKPNILFLTDDEHRWDFYAGGLIDGLETPSLDRLKRMGVTFSNAISNCPVCMPTRFTWLTGLYAGQSPAGPRNGRDWPDGHKTVAHALQRAGYETAIIGKLHSRRGRKADAQNERHLGELERNTAARGFDYVFEVQGPGRSVYSDHIIGKYGEDFYRRLRADRQSRDHRIGGTNLYSPSFVPAEDCVDTFITDEVVRWLGERSSDKPFFLHASLTGPHFPHDPPEPYFSRHKPEDMPAPVGVEDAGELKYWREQRAAYCGKIEHVDHLAGRILDAVEANGLLDNTIIVYSCDHGDMMGDHGLFYKIHPYDASIRTPTIIYDPASRRPGGTVLNDMVEAVDIPGTILAAGSDEHLQDAMPGSLSRSFLEYARGEADSHREWAYCEHGNLFETSVRAYRLVRDREWKYVFHVKGNMLYNIKDDPFEQNNLIDDRGQQERINAMQARIIRRMGRMVIPPESIETNIPVEFYKGISPKYPAMKELLTGVTAFQERGLR